MVKTLAGTMLLELALAQIPRGRARFAGLALLGRAQDDPGARVQAAGAPPRARYALAAPAKGLVPGQILVGGTADGTIPGYQHRRRGLCQLAESFDPFDKQAAASKADRARSTNPTTSSWLNLCMRAARLRMRPVN